MQGEGNLKINDKKQDYEVSKDPGSVVTIDKQSDIDQAAFPAIKMPLTTKHLELGEFDMETP